MTQEQEQLFELLVFFADFCEEHKLKYWLVGGTLLGAVRHKGFIPWDDDIDVAMPEDDYKKLFLQKWMLPKELEIQSQETEPAYPFLFAKLCNKRFPFETEQQYGPIGIYIDIFPLIKSGKPNMANRLLFNLNLIISYVLQVKARWSPNIPYKDVMARIVFEVLKVLPIPTLQNMQRGLADRLRHPKKWTTLCSLGGVYKADKEFFPREWFENSTKVLFEGKMFCAPGKWEAYLSSHYGDYMTLPPMEKRISGHK